MPYQFDTVPRSRYGSVASRLPLTLIDLPITRLASRLHSDKESPLQTKDAL